MKYLRKLFMTLLYPIILFIGEFTVQYIFVYLFNQREIRHLKNTYSNLSNTQIINKLNKLITTSNYQNRLSEYINNHSLLITIIVGSIFIPLFVFIYKNYRQKQSKVNLKDIIFIILLGISISTIFNITLNELNNIYPFTSQFKLSKIPLYIQIISSGIIGPVLEELVFRGIVYNKLKTFNSHKKSIILTSIIFALFHFSNFLNVIYAFIMSFLFIYVYEKYKQLRYSILLHMTANITTILIIYLIVKQILWLNMIALTISLITVILIYLKIIKKDVYNFK